MPCCLLLTFSYFHICLFVNHWGRTSPHIATSDDVIRGVRICVYRVSFFRVSLAVFIVYSILTRYTTSIWKVLSWIRCHGSLQSLLDRNLLASNRRVLVASILSTTYWLPIDRDTSSCRSINILHWGWHLARHILPWLHRALWSALTFFPSVMRQIRRSTDNSIIVQLLSQRLHLCEVCAL